ncbi:MAG TPA: hypothetical protein PKC80_10150 [Burkholderiaceae bacterium]|nr:hypothetical protein [Burkholderiaceae bacterium]
MGAKKIDAEPTRGFNKDTGREIVGADVLREHKREGIADALHPLTGMDRKQYKTYEHRFKLSPKVRQACYQLDRKIANAELDEKQSKKEDLERTQKILFDLRYHYHELKC